MSDKKKWGSGVYLCTCNSSFEADMLASKLAAENIPCVKKYIGASNFMEIALGSNITQEIELYVPEETLSVAKETIIPVPIEDDFEQ